MSMPKIDYATNTAEIDYDQFLLLIKNLDPKKKSMHNYVDSSTGKLLWAEGEPYSRIRLKKAPKQKAKKEKSLSFEKAYDELDNAVEEFLENLDVSDFRSEDNSVDESYIFDLADGFFWSNPEWEKWSIVLDMSKQDMQLYVAEMIQGKL